MSKVSFLLLVCFVLLYSCREDNTQDERESVHTQLKEKIDSLSELKTKVDSLQQLKGKDEDIDWFIPEVHAKGLIENGVQDPASFIKSELQKRKDLIPLEPVLGGNMEFRQIELLGSKWILAEYDDGHVMGRALYRYELTEERKVNFTLLDSVSR